MERLQVAAGLWFIAAFISMFFTEQFPALKPIVMWTFKIYAGIVITSILGAVLFSVVLSVRDAVMGQSEKVATPDRGIGWLGVKKYLYIVVAILGWLSAFAFFNFTHIGGTIMGVMGLIAGLVALGGGVLAFVYGIATDKDFRLLLRSILILGTAASFVIAFVYCIYLFGIFVIHWIQGLQ